MNFDYKSFNSEIKLYNTKSEEMEPLFIVIKPKYDYHIAINNSENQELGFADISINYEYERVKIEYLYTKRVTKDFKGMGTLLINTIKTITESLKFKKILVGAGYNSHSFYWEQGFRFRDKDIEKIFLDAIEEKRKEDSNYKIVNIQFNEKPYNFCEETMIWENK